MFYRKVVYSIDRNNFCKGHFGDLILGVEEKKLKIPLGKSRLPIRITGKFTEK